MADLLVERALCSLISNQISRPRILGLDQRCVPIPQLRMRRRRSASTADPLREVSQRGAVVSPLDPVRVRDREFGCAGCGIVTVMVELCELSAAAESAGFRRPTLCSCDIFDGPGSFLEVPGDLIVESSLPVA